MLLRLHTADHIRLASPMDKPQCPRTALHGTRIMRFAMCQQDAPVAVRGADPRQWIFSVLLHPHSASCPWAPTPSRPHVSGVFEIIRELTGMPLRLRQDPQQEPPGRGITLAELTHEGGVRRHLLPLEA